MAMQTLTIIQFIEMLLAYCIVILFLPWLILRKRLSRFSVAERIAGYFLAGNVFVIYLVFLLQFLHISNRFTLAVGTLFPVVILIWRKYRDRDILGGIQAMLLTIQRVLKGETGVKTLMVRGMHRILSKRKRGRWKVLLKYMPDILLTGAVVAGILYIYGTNTFTVYGYKASDLPVHNYWVNMMDDNKVFGAGVYPFGFHCIIYYLHTVFHIKTYILFRVFALVQTIFIHLAILVSMKILCKSRYAPYIGTGIYLMANIYSITTNNRFSSTLPQEYGMMFIFPAACFAIRFFQEYALVLKAGEESEKCEAQKRSRGYLLAFIISFSLTLTVHFYNTMIAGIFCVGIAAGYFFRCFRWKYFKQILIAGVLSVLLAVLPLLVGLAMGRGLEGSLYWGMKVIKGTADTTDQTTETKTITDADGNEVTVVGEVDEETLEKVKNGTITEGSVSSDNTGDSQIQNKDSGQGHKMTITKVLKIKFRAIVEEMKVYVANGNEQTVHVILLSIAAILVLGIFSMLTGRTDYGGMLWSVGIYMILMCIMQALGVLGLPELMDQSRNSIFLAYSTGILWSVAADALIYLTVGWFKTGRVSAVVSFILLIAVGTGAVKYDMIKSPSKVTALETNEAITCLTNIIRENKDFTWTIVSANDELRMTEKFGYHYETITLLQKMRDMSKNPRITIPTDTVYFFVEKTPVNYAQSADGMELGTISEEWAGKPLSKATGLTPYTGSERWVTMSHMYYWAEAFRKLYPNEMEIYYESEDFICYRLKQNDYSLYNLAIDYGYNDPKSSK